MPPGPLHPTLGHLYEQRQEMERRRRCAVDRLTPLRQRPGSLAGGSRDDLGRRTVEQYTANELIPFGHPGAFLPHVVPAIIALGADVLERMVLQAIADFFGEARFARQGLERPAQVAISGVRDHASLSLSPDKAVERSMRDGSGGVFG